MFDAALSPEQFLVINALSEGVNMTDAAAQAGIHRNTISNWLRGSPAFSQALAILDKAAAPLPSPSSEPAPVDPNRCTITHKSRYPPPREVNPILPNPLNLLLRPPCANRALKSGATRPAPAAAAKSSSAVALRTRSMRGSASVPDGRSVDLVARRVVNR